MIEPAHLLLDHLHDGVLDRLRGSSGVGRGNLDRRRSDRRILLDRHREDRQSSRKHDEERDDDREDRAVDKELGHGGLLAYFACEAGGGCGATPTAAAAVSAADGVAAAAVAACDSTASTTAPGCTFCTP